MKNIETAKANPQAMANIKDKEGFLGEADKLKATIDSITPPDTTGEQKDKLQTRLSVLESAVVHGDPATNAPRMISERESWENGASAPGNLLRWENFWGQHNIDANGAVVKCERGKGAKWEIKDLRRMIYKDEESDNPDCASLENIRPREAMEPLADVPRRSYGLSPQARANYDVAFPDHPATPVEAKITSNKADQRKAQSEKMKARWAARRAARKAVDTQAAGAAVA